MHGLIFPFELSLTLIILGFLQILLPIVSILTSIYFVFIFFTRPRRIRHPLPPGPPGKRILVVIPARNEESVIHRVLDNLRNINYPSHLIDIIVIADNCSDRTADVVRDAGYEVMVRNDLSGQSKAKALHWFFYDEGKLDSGYDAITILDADTVVEPDFFLHVEGRLRDGAKIVQGNRRALNPGDSIFSSVVGIMYAFESRLWYVPHTNHGLSTLILGTGVTITCDHLRLIGWDIRTLVEDAEFTIQSVLAGEKVQFCDEAVMYAETPVTLKLLWRQLRRWFSGQIDCGRFYLPAIWQKVREERGGQASILLVTLIIPFNCTLGVIQILVSFGTTYQLVGGRISPIAMISGLLANQLIGMGAAMVILILDNCVKPGFLKKFWKGILIFPYWSIFLGIIYIVSYIHPKKVWVPMEHNITR